MQHDYSVLTIIDESGRVSYIERVNGTSYAEISKRFTTALKRYKIEGGYVEINGPGLPVFEMLRAEVRKLRDWTTNNTNKVEGIRSLIYDIQGGTLMLPSKDFFPHLYQELSAYSYRISPNGTMTFNAPSGFFDDCVMSLMLANEARTKIAFSKSKLYVGGGVKLNMY